MPVRHRRRRGSLGPRLPWTIVEAAIAFAIGASPLTDDNPALGILLIGISVALLVLVAASVVRRRRRRSRTTRRAHSRC